MAKHEFRLTAACYLLFLAESLIFFRAVVFGGMVIPWDLQGFHLAHIHLYADALARGSFPLWDPFTYCGRPFQANIQTEVLYPSVALIAWLGSLPGAHDLFRMLEYNVILHTALAGMFAFRLGRVLGLGLPASFALGSAYQMGAFFAIHAEHMGAITIAAWLPLAWASVVELGAEPRLRPALLLTLALSLSVLGGLTPLTAIEAASVAVLALLLVGAGKASWKTPAAVILCGVAAILLTLVQIAPTYQLLGQSIGEYRAAWLKSGGGVPLKAFVTMVWPNYWGAFQIATYHLNVDLTFSYLYCGAVTLALALWAAVMAWKSRLHTVFLILAVLTAFEMSGDSTWPGRALYALLPLSIRIGLHPEYTMPAFLLAVSVLAAFGLERLTRNPRSRWILAAAVALDVLLVNSGRIWNAADPKGAPVMTRDAFEGHREPVATLRRLAETATPPWRFDTLHGAMPWAMYAPVFAIPTATGNDPLALSRVIHARLAFTTGERWGAYYEPEQLASPALAMMNVKYLVSRSLLGPSDAGSEKLRLAASVPGFSIYENPAALPRFWLAGSVERAQSEDEAWRHLAGVSLPRAVVERFPGGVVDAGDSPGTVRVIRYEPERIELETTASRECFLATSEANYPGWKAWVDAGSVPVYYTNVAFRGIAIPAGTHRVTMRFAPRLFFGCAALSGAAWLGWLILWFWRARLQSPAHRQLNNV